MMMDAGRNAEQDKRFAETGPGVRMQSIRSPIGNWFLCSIVSGHTNTITCTLHSVLARSRFRQLRAVGPLSLQR